MTDPWYSKNALRDYPLVDGSTPPEGLIVDAGFVIDPDAGFLPSANTVRLLTVTRIAGGYQVSVGVDCEVDRDLQFFVPDGWGEWLTVRSDEVPSDSSSSRSSGGWNAPSASWFGYLVIGRESDWQTYLPSGSVTYAVGQAAFEPARTSVGRSRVRAIRIANQQRLRVSAPAVCDADSSASQTVVQDLSYVEWGPPLTGPEVTLVEGHNLTVRVSNSKLTFAARPGTGAGEVCEEIPLRPNEEPPEGSVLLTGGPTCGELVRTINGLPGKTVRVIGDVGVNVAADQAAFTVTVSVDPAAFDRWPSAGSSSSSAGGA